MDLTSLFSRKDEWKWGLILSYDLDAADFFENQILSRIVVKNNLTIIIDSQNRHNLLYSDNARPRYAGVYYNIEDVALKGNGRFHPKLLLLLNDHEVQLTIGSFNLTESGFKKNLETVIHRRVKVSDLTKQDIALCKGTERVLQSAFIEQNSLLDFVPQTVKTSIQEILNSPFFGQLPDETDRPNDPSNGQDVQFLFNTEQDLFSQLKAIVGDHPQCIELFSPYFDDKLEAVQHLAQWSDDIRLYVPAKTDFPAELFFDSHWLTERCQLKKVSLNENNIERPIHAKLYKFVTSHGSWLFVTSANCTPAGLTNNGIPRNFEIGLLSQTTESSAFPGARGLEIESVTDPNQLQPLAQENISVEQSEETTEWIPSLHAWYEKHRIWFEFKDPPDAENERKFSCELMVDQFGQGEYDVGYEGGLYFFEPEFEISGNSLLQMVLIDEKDGVRSLPLYISRSEHNPNHLPVLGLSAFQRCLQKGGFPGIRQAIEFAQQSGREDWFLYLLEHWDLRRILQGDNKNKGGEETSEDIVPELRKRKRTDYKQKMFKKNIELLADYQEFSEKLQGYLQDTVKKASEDCLGKFNELCFPAIFQLSKHFNDILTREEEKHQRDPELRYPYYTWLENFHTYLKNARYIHNILSEQLDVVYSAGLSPNERWRFATNALLWYEGMHTEKTQRKLAEELRNFNSTMEQYRQLTGYLFVSTDTTELPILEVENVYRAYGVNLDSVLGTAPTP